jgi:hypothetical protein
MFEQKRIILSSQSLRFVGFICFLLLIISCTVKFVAPFDEKTENQIFKTAKLIDTFYGQLLETNESDRKYENFSTQYVEIETEINMLIMRNKVRTLNEESTKISKNILTLWLKYMKRHKEKDTYSSGNAKLERKRFTTNFAYALGAEQVKKEIQND